MHDTFSGRQPWLLSSALSLALILDACGGTQAARSETAVEAGPALPEIPEDPMALLPGEPSALMRVDLGALRSSPNYPRLARWAETHGCARPGPDHWLLARAQIALVAQYPPAEERQSDEGLLILRGELAQGSARAALIEASEAMGQGDIPLSEAKAGRFRLLTKGELAAVQLDASSLALGSVARVKALLDVADGRAPAGAQAMRDAHGGRGWLEGRMLALLFAPDSRRAQHLRQRLGSFGSERLGAGLGKRPLALGLSLDADPTLELRLGFVTVEDAEAAIVEGKKMAWQANLVLRLAGLPPVLDRVEMHAEDSVAALSLKLRQAEAEKLIERAERVLRGQTRSRCGAQGG